MKIHLFSVLSLALAFSLACGGGDTKIATPELPPPPPTPVAADGSIGVPECDDYIKKMEACIATADPLVKPTLESSFKTTKDAWVQAAATPATREALGSACTTMLATVDATCAAANPGTTVTGTAATGTTATGTAATGTTATGTNPDGTPKPTTTTTTTTVVTTTDATKATEPATKASPTGDKAPARDTRAPADMGRSRNGGSGTSGTKSGSGSGTKEGSQGMGRSR